MTDEEANTLRQQLADTRRDLDEWKTAHRELAAMLGATNRGRDHCDAELVITAIKRTFRITHLAVTRDASEVLITTTDGFHRVPTTIVSVAREHQWDAGARYDGSIAEGPPPGAHHRQAMIYACSRCRASCVEPLTPDQEKTLSDSALFQRGVLADTPKKNLPPKYRLVARDSPCDGIGEEPIERQSPRFKTPQEEHAPRLVRHPWPMLRIDSCSCGWQRPSGIQDSDDAFARHVATAIASGQTDWDQQHAPSTRVVKLESDLVLKVISWIQADRIADQHSAELERAKLAADAHMFPRRGQPPDDRTRELLAALERAKADFHLADQLAVRCDDEFRQVAGQLADELEKPSDTP